MLKRPWRQSTSRNRLSPSNTPPGPALLPVITNVAGKARISCPAPVVVRALPVAITRQAAGAGAQLPPTAVTVVDSQTFDLTYAGSLTTTDIVTIPSNVSEIRGVAGGQLAATAKTF
ncbi:MAG: hypothetical protein WB347_21330 [Terriglobales bacterium]